MFDKEELSILCSSAGGGAIAAGVVTMASQKPFAPVLAGLIACLLGIAFAWLSENEAVENPQGA